MRSPLFPLTNAITTRRWRWRREEKEVEKEATGDHEVYPPPPLSAPARDALVTPVSLPLSWGWIRGIGVIHNWFIEPPSPLPTPARAVQATQKRST